MGVFTLVGLGVVLSTLWPAPARGADVRTVLDLKGQIIAIVDSDGSVATYSWDLSGNLTGITRISPGAGPVAITLVSPNQGLPNAPIEIFGVGLANPTSVTFNGVAATIQDSSANHITVTVPPTATSGIIHVVTPLGQADSPSAFSVLTGLTIAPSSASVLPTRTVQFTASGPAEWLVNGVLNGAPETGTISGGLYTAPSTGPFPLQVTVAAQSPGQPSNQAEAIVTILPTPVARATPVSGVVAPVPTQANPLRAPAVTGLVLTPPTQAIPLPAVPVTGTRQPLITAVSPASVARGSTNVTLTLTGQGLSSPTALQFLLNGANDTTISVSNLTARGSTQATATISIASTATIAARVLQLTAGGVNSTPAGTGTNVLQVTGP